MRVLIVLALLVDAVLAYKVFTYDAEATMRREAVRARELHTELMRTY